MSQRLHTMKLRVVWLLCGLMAVTALAGEAANGRFSQALTTVEQTEAGLGRLSSDQVAALDALFRRDLAEQANPRRGDPAPAPRFSQRLSADERRVAGLTLLTEAELTRLDALAERTASATLTRLLLAPPVFVPAGMRELPREGKPGPEVHGSFTLGYGWGKGGYSEKTGAATFRIEDPAHGFTINLGYEETKTNSPFPYRLVPGSPLPVTP